MSSPLTSIRVDGMPALRRALRDLGDDLQDVKDLNSDVASFVGARAAQAAPRQSGMLAASWRPSGTKTRAAVKFGGARVPYANAIHWGTGPRPGRRGPHNIAASLWATNTVANLEPKWIEFYIDAIEKIVQKAETR